MSMKTNMDIMKLMACQEISMLTPYLISKKPVELEMICQSIDLFVNDLGELAEHVNNVIKSKEKTNDNTGESDSKAKEHETSKTSR